MYFTVTSHALILNQHSNDKFQNIRLTAAPPMPRTQSGVSTISFAGPRGNRSVTLYFVSSVVPPTKIRGSVAFAAGDYPAIIDTNLSLSRPRALTSTYAAADSARCPGRAREAGRTRFARDRDDVASRTRATCNLRAAGSPFARETKRRSPTRRYEKTNRQRETMRLKSRHMT